jgi:CTP:molybdopterin cytidylyltransferase MocA
MSNPDLQRLSAALEYVDLAAGLYLAGGADQAARLLAAAAEQQLGDLVQLIDAPSATVDTRELLARIARAHRPAVVAPRQEAERDWNGEPVEADATREEILAYLRASWFMLEAMGLASLAPARLQEAVDNSTVFSSGSSLEPFV